MGLKVSQLPPLSSTPTQAAFLPAVQGGVTYQVPLALLRDAVWLPPPSNATDNAANLKSAIADCISGGIGRTLFIPPGTYLFNDSFTVANVSGIRIVGAGHQSRLVSTLNDTTKIFLEFEDVRESVLANVYITANAAIGGAVRLRNVTAGSVTPSMNTVESVHIEGQNRFGHALMVGGENYLDRNNDFNVFRNVYAIGYTTTGCYMRAHSQSYGNLFDQCLFYGGTGATHGINAGGNFAGNFTWRGGFMHNHSISDFNIGRSYQPYVIDGVNSEGSARFITSDSQAYMNLSVKHNRWAGNSVNTLGKFIQLSGNVQAVFEDNSFGDGAEDKELFVELTNMHALSRIVFNRNRVYSSAFAVFNETLANELTGNQKITHEGNGTTVALTL